MTLQTVEVEIGSPEASVIWLHGLGADGHDFEPLAPQLAGGRAWRFVFPHAPLRPVTLNGGMAMRAWYDIASLDRGSMQDANGLRQSAAAVGELIRRENARGIDSRRIVLGGFSQGGALSLYAGLRYPERLAGIMALSCYLPVAETLGAERSSANLQVPLFMAHGRFDPLVLPELGEESHDFLQQQGYTVDWHAYPMPHTVSPPEIIDMARWLQRVLYKDS